MNTTWILKSKLGKYWHDSTQEWVNGIDNATLYVQPLDAMAEALRMSSLPVMQPYYVMRLNRDGHELESLHLNELPKFWSIDYLNTVQRQSCDGVVVVGPLLSFYRWASMYSNEISPCEGIADEEDEPIESEMVKLKLLGFTEVVLPSGVHVKLASIPDEVFDMKEFQNYSVRTAVEDDTTDHLGTEVQTMKDTNTLVNEFLFNYWSSQIASRLGMEKYVRLRKERLGRIQYAGVALMQGKLGQALIEGLIDKLREQFTVKGSWVHETIEGEELDDDDVYYVYEFSLPGNNEPDTDKPDLDNSFDMPTTAQPMLLPLPRDFISMLLVQLTYMGAAIVLIAKEYADTGMSWPTFALSLTLLPLLYTAYRLKRIITKWWADEKHVRALSMKGVTK